MTPRTSASTRVQPTRADNPTSGGFGVGRQMAARAANLKTDHTLVTPSRSRIVHPTPLRDRVSPRSFGIKARHPGSSVSEDANGWPPKMTVMGRRVGAAVARVARGKAVSDET